VEAGSPVSVFTSQITRSTSTVPSSHLLPRGSRSFQRGSLLTTANIVGDVRRDRLKKEESTSGAVG
jgi:hypothetical protein